MKLIYVGVLVSIVFMSGCESTSQESSNLPTRSKFASTKFAPNALSANIVFAKSCQFDMGKQGISEFLGLFIPAAIDLTVNSLVKAVQKAGEDKTKSISAYKDNNFYSIKDNFVEYKASDTSGCMSIIIPNVDEDAQLFANSYAYAAQFDAYKLTKEPVFFLEMKIEQSSDGKLFRLHPTFLLKTKHLHATTNEKIKNLVIALDYRKPGGTEDTDTFATSLIELDDLTLGKAYNKDDLKNVATPWMKLPGVEKDKIQIINDLKAAKSEMNAVQHELCSDAYHYSLYPDIRQNDTVTDSYLKSLLSRKECKDSLPWKDFSHITKDTYEDAYKATKTSAEVTVSQSLLVQKNGKESDAEKKLVDVTHNSARSAEWYAAVQILGPKRDSLANKSAKVNATQKKLEKTALSAGHYEVFAEIVEVKEGNKFFKALGTILSESKDPLNEYLKGKFDPAAKASAAEIAATEQEKNKKAKFDLQVLLFEAERQVELATIAIGNAQTATELANANANLRKAQLEVEEYQRRLALVQ